MRRPKRPSLVEVERAWIRIREEIDKLENSNDISALNRARAKLLAFEQENPDADFIKLESQFDNQASRPNTAEAERYWWELRSNIEAESPHGAGWLNAQTVLRDFELKHPELDLHDLRVRFETYFEPPVNNDRR